MKSAKPPAAEPSSHRRSQPVRQTRTNPPRTSSNLGRSGGRDSIGGGPLSDHPIDIFPAITHFADSITALPKELVRHFTLLKEVDAKLFSPEEQLFHLVDAASKAPLPEARPNNEASSSAAPTSAPMSAQNSSSGITINNSLQPAPSTDESHKDLVFDPSNLPRRHLYRQTAIKIQEMLVSLEEKNHVISAANEALDGQLARADDVWPHLENEFSDEAKWGSVTHWAYPENRTGKSSHADRARRDGAAAISAAAQAIADEAAARSDARKQAVQAKKNSRNQNNAHAHHDSDFDDQDGRHKNETTKKAHGGKSRKTAENNNVGLGITTGATASNNPPQKRRKVEKPTNGAAPTERAMSTVFGNAAPKTKPVSPRATPAPEGSKKRKALPSGSGQAKKRNGVTGASPSVTLSPVFPELPEPKTAAVRASPAPGATPQPAPSRARQNSIQSIKIENGKARPSSSASTNKPNGNQNPTPEPGAAVAATSSWPRAMPEMNPAKEASAAIKAEAAKKEPERPEPATAPAPATNNKKENNNKADENDGKSEPAPPAAPNPVTTKSGRASKPSTPALATFHEAQRSRSSRAEGGGGGGGTKKSQKKAPATTIHAAVANSHLADEDTNSSMQGDEEEGEVDGEEPTFCYCNGVSWGEMVACDADGCPREWFHLECVGLRVAPTTKAKWYCEDCKERLKMGSRKVNGR